MVGFSLIILGGGKGERIGKNKPFLKIKGKNILEIQVEKLARVSKEIIFVVNKKPLKKIDLAKVVFDDFPYFGPLGGILSGLKASSSYWNFVVAGDMPFINLDLINFLASQREDFDVVVPFLNGKPEPLFAFYSKSCLKAIEKKVKEGERKVISFFSDVNVKYVDEEEVRKYDPELLSFFNINTDGDYQKALAIAGREVALKPIISRKKARKRFNRNLPEERGATIILNEKELVTLSATPRDLKELAIGFLFTEGIIEKVDEIKEISVDADYYIWVKVRKKISFPRLQRRILTSGCGRGFTFSFNEKILTQVKDSFKVSPIKIFELVKETTQSASLYRESGGIHSSSISSSEKILSIKEDIGRHNSVDKVIGDCLLKGKLMEGKILITTGRISSEVLLKAIRARLPIIVSLSSPTDASVELGKKYKLTIIGYVRGKNMVVYTHKERLVAEN